MGGIIIVLIIIGILGLMAAVAYLAQVAEKKRTERLRQVADEIGMEFLPAGDSLLQGNLGRFPLFSHGQGRKLWNLIRARTPEVGLDVFEYLYVTGSGKNRHTYRQSVISFQFDQPSLPMFTLRPQSFWHKIGSWFGYKDIDFDSHPVFSSRFFLRGANEKAIRRLFTPSVLEFFEQHLGVSVEGSGDRLVYYRDSQQVAPENVRSFMEEGYEVLALFRTSGSPA